MDARFWLDKWQRDETGFHQSATHPMLERFWGMTGCAGGGRVLVPLCGKSLDMVWLRERGCEVVGVELSPRALEAFFGERGLPCERSPAGALTAWHAGGYTLFEGDVLDLDPTRLGAVDAAYDRAALIALPPETRAAYAGRLTRLLPAGAALLLVTVAYDPARVEAPPFIVDDAELERLFAGDWHLQRLASEAAEVKGEAATETAWLLRRRTTDAG